MIVHRAKPREKHRSALVAVGQAGCAEKPSEIKRLSLDEKTSLGRDVGERQVASIRREHHRVGGGIDRPRTGLEFAKEKLVEWIVLIHQLVEFTLVQAVLLDEWPDPNPAWNDVHPAAVPHGKDPPANEQPLCQPAKRIAVHPAQRPLAVNGLSLYLSIAAIDIPYLPVGQVILDAHAPAGYPPPA